MAVDVAGDVREEGVHAGERCLVLWRRTMGDLFVRRNALLRARHRRDTRLFAKGLQIYLTAVGYFLT